MAKYPASQTVSVYYNPRDPNDVVLEPRLESAGISLGFGISSGLLAALGVYLLYLGFRGLYRTRT